jgi:hypothetical protein
VGENEQDGEVEHPARTTDDPQEAAEEVVEAGHDTSGGDPDTTPGAGTSGGAPTGGTGEGDSSATGAGPSGGAPADSSTGAGGA